MRPDDPLPPYLFISCGDVVFGLLPNKIGENKIHGIKIVRGAPYNSHLFLVDDSLHFAQENVNDVRTKLVRRNMTPTYFDDNQIILWEQFKALIF